MIGIEPETGEGNCFWESEYYAFPDDISLNDYVKIGSVIEKKSGLLVATNIVKLENHE